MDGIEKKIGDSLGPINERIALLYERICFIAKHIEGIKSQEKKTQSDELHELFAALAKAQSEMGVAGENSLNPYFKSNYADLAAIIKASRPALSKHNLCVVQQIVSNSSQQNMLHTILGHSSGQWIESRMRILPTKSDIQSLGSYITYLKRYSYAAIIGVVSSREDDDGEKAMEEDRKEATKGTALNRQYAQPKGVLPTITKEQLEEMQYELQEYPDIAEDVLHGFKIQALGDMPKSKFQVAINRIREIKKIREE